MTTDIANSPKIPDRLRTEFTDIMLCIIDKYCDNQLNIVITFDRFIDEGIFAKALRLSLDAEPVFGCRFVPRFFKPHWQRCEGLHEMTLCDVLETDDFDGETLKFTLTTINRTEGARVFARILRGAKNDRVLVKVDHKVADAGGCKEYAYLLASIYRNLASDPGYRPTPNLEGSRSFKQVWRRFSLLDRFKIFLSGLRFSKKWHLPRNYWSLTTSGDKRDYLIRRVEPEKFAAIRRLCQKMGATINDVIVAALFRTFYEFITPPTGTPLRIVNTADLRRYLPTGRGEAICNLSGFVYLTIGERLGKDIEETVRIVNKEMTLYKKSYIGLGDYFLFPTIVKWIPFKWLVPFFNSVLEQPIKAGNVPMGITNMGRFNEKQLDFGAPKPLDAFLTVPPGYPPSFLMGITGFGNSLTFTMGFSRNGENDDTVVKFFDRLFENLPG